MGALLAAVVALAAETGPPAMLDALLDERHTLALSDLVDRVQLADDEGFRVAEFGRDAHSSHHVVAIRDREVPHRHDRHDLFVVMVRGHGFMRLGDEERAVGEHSVLYVPRGTPHAFRNVTDAPAIAYAVYSPAFDGKDRVIVE
jgi:mannose-6-phosphate isomerase-like protein (cupin superfamily)